MGPFKSPPGLCEMNHWIPLHVVCIHVTEMDDGYEFLKSVGKGSMGECTLVQSRTSGEKFIVKSMDLSDMCRREKKSCLQEGKLLRNLTHPNIVEYKDSFYEPEGQKMHILMAFAAGGDLAKRLKTQRGAVQQRDAGDSWGRDRACRPGEPNMPPQLVA